MSIPILLKIAGIEGRMMTALKFEHQDDTNAGDYDINVTVHTIKCGSLYKDMLLNLLPIFILQLIL